jgi:hypothetical protein
MSATLTSQPKSYISERATATKCKGCSRYTASHAKFCSECGSETMTVPTFAELKGHIPIKVEPALAAELKELDFNMFRQKVFLGIHVGSFLLLNLTGVVLAIKCYLGVYGDEGTKLALALIPMFYINLCALVFLSYIKGTRTEMQILRQKISRIRFKIEYGSIL